MSFSDFIELEILDQIFGGEAYTAPANLFVALFTAAPSDAGGGTEVTGNGYARVSVANNLTNWPAASAGAKSNGVAIQFPTASGGNWGTVTHFGIYDASTAGNLIGWAALTASQVINDGTTATFAIGDLDITLD